MQSDPRVNILLVDDRQENLVALVSVLGDLGQNLVTATSGLDALRCLLDDDFAVILLDVQMPGMDGFETATLIRSRDRNKDTPIVFLTAINKGETHVSRGYSVGAVDYLFKPFDPDVLRAKVAAFVELAKKRQELQEEIAHRKRAESAVRELNEELEDRVLQRTAELAATNRELESEIGVRKLAEAEVRRLLVREQAARADAEAAQLRLTFLSDASGILARSLDYHTTLQRVAALLVPGLADFCLIDLIGEDRQVRRLGYSHAVEQKQDLLHQLQLHYAPTLDSPQPAARAMRSGTAELVTDVSPAWLAAASADEGHHRILEELDPVSYLVVPLVARGLTIGALTLGSAESGRRYGPEDLTLAEDLARRAAAAIENARLYHELEEAARRKDEFLAMLAHELRNPLAAISSADYALDQAPPPDRRRAARLRGVISRQTRHLARLVDDLLDMSRINRGSIELRKEVVDLGAIVQRAVEANLALIEQRSHEIAVEIPPEPVLLEADPTRLEQMLSNLVNNAAKYTDPGGRIAVSVEAETTRFNHQPSTITSTLPHSHTPRQALIRVRDTGVGIPQELLPYIFGLFTQADRSPDRSLGGLGIGLALVQRLAQMHGGDVEARSEGPGKGSEFILRIPLLEVGANGKHRREKITGPPPAAGEQRSLRVLLVEDNRDAADTLNEILALWGHEVRVCGDGLAALAEAAAFQPEVVLLDIGLPGMDGYEVARRLRDAKSKVQSPRSKGRRSKAADAGSSNGRGKHAEESEAGPQSAIRNPQPAIEGVRNPQSAMLLIALSGYGQEENRRRSLEAGFDLHLTKPVEPQELQDLLARIAAEPPKETAAA